MKRRLKLILTVIILSCTIAVLGVGVYASTTSSFSITSTVTFDIDVECTITGSTYHCASNGTLSATTKIGTSLNETIATGQTLNNHSWNSYANDVQLSIAKPELVWKIDIQNNSSEKPLEVKVVALEGSAYVIKHATGTNTKMRWGTENWINNPTETQVEDLAVSSSISLEVRLTLTDFSASIDTQAVGFKVIVQHANLD